MGLRALLESRASMEVSEAANGLEAVEKARELRPDIVVMDIRMPGIDGIEATRRIRQEQPDVGILVLSAVDDETQIFEAIEAGANGYITKDDDPSTLVQGALNVAQGRAYLPPNIAKRVLERVAETRGARPGRTTAEGKAMLTERESAVLRLIAQGKRNREIAELLHISERTVSNHVANVYGKIGVKDRARAIAYAFQEGLVTVDESLGKPPT